MIEGGRVVGFLSGGMEARGWGEWETGVRVLGLLGGSWRLCWGRAGGERERARLVLVGWRACQRHVCVGFGGLGGDAMAGGIIVPFNFFFPFAVGESVGRVPFFWAGFDWIRDVVVGGSWVC